MNDVWQQDVFKVFGFDMPTIRDPVTGRDPLGSLYFSLIQCVDECILKKKSGENGSGGDGHLGTGEDVVKEEGDEADGKEGAKEQIVDGIGQHGGSEGERGGNDGLNQMSIEAEYHRHEDPVMGLIGEGVQDLSLSNASTSRRA